MIHDLMIRSSQQQCIVTTTKLFKSYSLHEKKKKNVHREYFMLQSIDEYISKIFFVLLCVDEKFYFLDDGSESNIHEKLAATAIVAPYTSWISTM